VDVHEVVVPYGVVTAGAEDGMDDAEAPVMYWGGRGKSWLRYLQRAWV
jgi:hypothetical protein